MASLIDSFRSMAGDQWWFVKIAFFSAVLFFVLYNSYYYSPDKIFIISSITGALFLGCASVAVNRNINNITPLFPSLFSIFEVIIKSICSSIVIIPGLLIYYLCMTFVQTKLEFEPFVMAVIYIIITVIFAPFIFIPVVLYSVKGNLLDAYRVNLILQGAGNYAVQFMSYIIQYILIFCTITICFYFLLLNMFGDHVSLLILKSIVIVLSFFSIFVFSSDLYGDAIPEIKRKKIKKNNVKSKRKIS